MDPKSTKWAAFLEDASFLSGSAPLSPREPLRVLHRVSPDARRALCSDAALQRDGIRTVAGEDGEALEMLVTPCPGGLWEIGASFHWGYSRALFMLGPMQMRREAIAPGVGETEWAATFDTFEEAREAFASGGYHEALELLEGLGAVEEWRVHFLLGLLRLGFAGGLHAIIDLERAEEAFRTAARYSQAHDRTIATQALTAAAVCANLLGSPGRALGYAEAAARLGELLAEMEFVAAQAAFQQGELDSATARLSQVLKMGRGYVIRLGEVERWMADPEGASSLYATVGLKLWEALRLDVATTLQSAPGVARLEGTGEPAIAGRRLATLVTHGAKLPLYDMLQTHARRDELLALALEGASATRISRSRFSQGPEVARMEIKTTERQVREKVIKREASLFRKEEVEWVTKTQKRTESVLVKRPSRLRHVEIQDAAGQILGVQTLVRIPRGTFTMGSPPDSALRGDDELRHDVTLTKPFYVGQAPVTQGFWVAIQNHNPSFFQGEKLPVEQISFFDAARFCNALSEMENLTPVYEINDTEVLWVHRGQAGYRMLTEAEWEYACRADTQTTYFCGEELTKVHATFGRNQGARTTNWDLFQPNPWGLYDVHGNVWEWCFDGYGRYETGDVMDPVNDRDVEARVARGGSWASENSECRSATRNSYSPWHHHNNVGFRIAIDATDEDP